jgi:hypothetical protein
VSTLTQRLSAVLPRREDVTRYWLEVGDASTLVLVRTVYGVAALFWALSLAPDVDEIFFADGLRPDRTFGQGRVFSIFRWVDADAAFVVGVALMIVCSAMVVAGRHVRLAVPITALLQISLIQASRPWASGAELTLMLGAVYLGVFHAVTPTAHLGHFADSTGLRGRSPLWGLRLMQLQLAIGYLSTAGSKLGGHDWTDGSAVFHAIEAEQLQRFEPPAFMTDYVLVVVAMTYTVLLVELALGPLLLWPRTRRAAMLVALALHASFEVFLELGFFAIAMSVLILSFAWPADVDRLLRPLQRVRRVRTSVAST